MWYSCMNDFPQNKISVRGPLDPYMERVDPCFINALSLVTLCDQVFVHHVDHSLPGASMNLGNLS